MLKKIKYFIIKNFFYWIVPSLEVHIAKEAFPASARSTYRAREAA